MPVWASPPRLDLKKTFAVLLWPWVSANTWQYHSQIVDYVVRESVPPRPVFYWSLSRNCCLGNTIFVARRRLVQPLRRLQICPTFVHLVVSWYLAPLKFSSWAVADFSPPPSNLSIITTVHLSLRSHLYLNSYHVSQKLNSTAKTESLIRFKYFHTWVRDCTVFPDQVTWSLLNHCPARYKIMTYNFKVPVRHGTARFSSPHDRRSHCLFIAISRAANTCHAQ